MSVVLTAAAAYWILLFSVRLIGRRTASQLAPFDLVVLFLFAGATITAVLGNDHSLTAAFSAVCTIGLMHIIASVLKTRFEWFGRVVDGTPVIIVEHGKPHAGRMRALRLVEQDVMTAVRQRGLERLAQVRYAVAERDGKISIIAED
jgi:uncharacterized membrane protein YcaP (DUF421 family)